MRRYRSLDPSPSALPVTLFKMRTALDFPCAAVTLVDETTRYPFCATGPMTLTVSPRSQTACGHVVATGEPLVGHRRPGENPEMADPGVVSYVGVPLVGAEGTVIGALCAYDDADHPVPDTLLADMVQWGRIVSDQLELLRRRSEANLPSETSAAAMHAAIDAGQIVPWYQPIIDLTTGEVSGYEALARWEHPVRGVLAPAVFLTETEDTELIIDLDLAILAQATRDLPGIVSEATSSRGLNVNLSARHFDHDDCVDRLTATTAASGAPTSALSLELTEHRELYPSSRHVDLLGDLRSRGFRVVLDDFGSGWSHLEHLAHLPLDGLKIDRTITTTLGTAAGDAVVSAIAWLGKRLDLTTTVEGVDTAALADRAAELGITHAQGHFWSAALPVRNLRTTGPRTTQDRAVR